MSCRMHCVSEALCLQILPQLPSPLQPAHLCDDLAFPTAPIGYLGYRIQPIPLGIRALPRAAITSCYWLLWRVSFHTTSVLQGHRVIRSGILPVQELSHSQLSVTERPVRIRRSNFPTIQITHTQLSEFEIPGR